MSGSIAIRLSLSRRPENKEELAFLLHGIYTAVDASNVPDECLAKPAAVLAAAAMTLLSSGLCQDAEQIQATLHAMAGDIAVIAVKLSEALKLEAAENEECDCPRCQATREAEAKEAARVKAADEQAAKWAAEEAVLEAIADGSTGEGPMTRGAARDRLAKLREQRGNGHAD